MSFAFLGELAELLEAAEAELGAADAAVADTEGAFADAGFDAGFEGDASEIDGLAEDFGSDEAIGEAGDGEALEGAAEGDGVVDESGASIWTKPKAFLKFVLVEAGKGALFFAGMKAVEKIFAPAPGAAGQKLSPEQQQLADSLSAMTSGVKLLKDVADDWHKWLKEHRTQASSFGAVTIDIDGSPLTLSHFEAVVRKLAKLDLERTELMKTLTAAAKSKRLEDLQKAKPGLKAYCASMTVFAQAIRDKQPLMVKKGLEDHLEDLAKTKVFIDKA